MVLRAGGETCASGARRVRDHYKRRVRRRSGCRLQLFGDGRIACAGDASVFALRSSVRLTEEI
jgi:hypothetical protein